jgi:hypothetical protein
MDAGRMVLEDKQSDLKSSPLTSDKGAQVFVNHNSDLSRVIFNNLINRFQNFLAFTQENHLE